MFFVPSVNDKFELVRFLAMYHNVDENLVRVVNLSSDDHVFKSLR